MVSRRAALAEEQCQEPEWTDGPEERAGGEGMEAWGVNSCFEKLEKKEG